jgi:branched-chain amino acid transport system substrate-binding protein
MFPNPTDLFALQIDVGANVANTEEILPTGEVTMHNRAIVLGRACDGAAGRAIAAKTSRRSRIAPGGPTMKRLTWKLLGLLALTLAAVSHARAEILIGDPGPLTGSVAWAGEQSHVGTELAVADFNAKGGVLGEQIRVISVDDACNAEQGVAAARKLISDGAMFVVGHICSGAAIPTAPLYEAAGVIVMSPSATNPRLTDEGRANVFRVVGRDDQQGIIAGNYLADQWSEKKIAILHDGEAYGRGLAEETKKTLNARGVREVMFEQITPGLVDYSDVVDMIQTTSVDVLYYAGYPPEAGLLIRQLRDRGDDLQLVSADGINTEDFWLIAGPAGEGTLFTSFRDPSRDPGAAAILERAREHGIVPNFRVLYSYGAVQAWAAAVERAGSLEPAAVSRSLHSHEFDTVLGRIRFDEKGDVSPSAFEWFVWTSGEFVPRDQAD